MPLPVGSLSQYNLRNSNNYVLPNCRLEINKKSFFPFTTRDWNNLSPEIRNSGNINIFKRKIKILLEKVPFYFGWGDRKLNIIHSRLRNMCSWLNADLHLVSLKPSPACICGHGFEDCIHFFLECPFYNENRAILFNKLKNYVVTIELILAGDENLTPNQNIEIFSVVYSFIRSTQHFN